MSLKLIGYGVSILINVSSYQLMNVVQCKMEINPVLISSQVLRLSSVPGCYNLQSSKSFVQLKSSSLVSSRSFGVKILLTTSGNGCWTSLSSELSCHASTCHCSIGSHALWLWLISYVTLQCQQCRIVKQHGMSNNTVRYRINGANHPMERDKHN